MRALLLALLFAAPAGAQERFAMEVTTDRTTYEAGEPITVRVEIQNVSGERSTIWVPDGCAPQLQIGSLTSPGEAGACTLLEEPITLDAWGATVRVWVLDPARLGVPEADGAQTVSSSLSGRCGPGPSESGASRSEACAVRGEATFEAPRAVGGTLALSYAPADADSVLSLRGTYGATVTDSSFASCCGYREVWQVDGVRLGDAVEALDGNGAVQWAEAFRLFEPADVFITSTVSSSPPAVHVTPLAPNPAAASASFTVRLATPEAVMVDLLDALGRRVVMLYDGPLAGGVNHPFMLRAETLAPGTYVVRVTGAVTRQTQRLVVVR